jgi:2'-5' RNA ligase
MPRRTALIVVVPEAEPFVGALRLAHDPSAALGVPAHITVLFPFAPPESIDEEAVGALIGAHAPFDYQLTGVAVFADGATYLTPVPAEPFVALTSAVAARWPEHPPYAGAFARVVPHLTVSAAAAVVVDAPFPIAAHTDEVTLIEEDERGRWAERRRLALGPG